MFDLDGFDKEGYAISGLGQKTCSYSTEVGNKTSTSGLWAWTTHPVYIEDVIVATIGKGKNNVTTNGIKYSFGELKIGSFNCNVRTFAVCSQQVK